METEIFDANEGLWHGCVMSLWILNLLIDKMVRKMDIVGRKMRMRNEYFKLVM